MSPQISKNKSYCTGQELVDAWGIHPSYLSLCMILGLQPYSKKVCRPVFDPVPLTESVKDAAWRTLTEFTGKDGPKRFQGNALPPGGVDWMPYRLFGAAVTIDELIRQHLDCLFRTDDALKFQSEFGLGRNANSTADSETRISENFKEKERIDQEVEVYPTKRELPFPCDAGTTWEQITFLLKTDELVHVKTPKGDARLHYSQLSFSDRRKGDSPNTTTWPLFQALARLNGNIVLQGQDYIRNLPDNAGRLNKSLKKLFEIDQSIWTGHYRKSKSYKARFMIRDDRNP